MKISELADSFVFSRSQQGITENFFDSFSVGIIFNAFNIFLGFSLIGYPLIIWLPFLRGMGLGTLSGYLYSVYRFTGLGYCALTVYPAAIVSTLAFVLACNDSCEYSKNAFAKAVKGRGQFEKDETKVYLIRQLIFIAVCALSSAADAVFTALFSGLFEI